MIIKLIFKQSYAKGSLQKKKKKTNHKCKKKINDKKKERKLPISSHPIRHHQHCPVTQRKRTLLRMPSLTIKNKQKPKQARSRPYSQVGN
jgi:hypothetical protein